MPVRCCLQDPFQPQALVIAGNLAGHADVVHGRHVDQEAAGQRDVRSDARALLSQRLLGDLNDNLLPFLQQVADGRDAGFFGARRGTDVGARSRLRNRPDFALRRARLARRTAVAAIAAIAIAASPAPHAARIAMLQEARILALFAQRGGEAGGNAGRFRPFLIHHGGLVLRLAFFDTLGLFGGFLFAENGFHAGRFQHFRGFGFQLGFGFGLVRRRLYHDDGFFQDFDFLGDFGDRSLQFRLRREGDLVDPGQHHRFDQRFGFLRGDRLRFGFAVRVRVPPGSLRLRFGLGFARGFRHSFQFTLLLDVLLVFVFGQGFTGQHEEIVRFGGRRGRFGGGNRFTGR